MTKFTNQPDPIRFQTNCAILLTYYTNVPIKSLKRHRKTISKVSLIKIFRSNIYFHSFFAIQKTLTSKQWKFQSVFETFFLLLPFTQLSSNKTEFFRKVLRNQKGIFFLVFEAPRVDDESRCGTGSQRKGIESVSHSAASQSIKRRGLFLA